MFYVAKTDPAMYTLVGRPWSSGGTITTSFFSNYLFSHVFGGVLQDVAINFHGENDFAFSGPIISTAMRAAEVYHGDGNSTRYKYTLSQRPSQEAALPLNRIFGGYTDESVNVSSVVFKRCVIVIGDPIPTTSKHPTSSSMTSTNFVPAAVNPEADPFSNPLFKPEDAAKALEEAAAVLRQQAIPADSQISKLEAYRKKNGFGWDGGAVDSRDLVNEAANGMITVAGIIKGCTSGGSTDCSAQSITSAVGGMLLSVAFVAGAACPPLGAVLAVIGTIASVVAIFLPGAKTSSLPSLTAYDVQDAVENALSKYGAAQAISDVDAIKTFVAIDVDLFKNFLNELGYIKAKNPRA